MSDVADDPRPERVLADARPPVRGIVRSELRSGLEIAALVGFAVVQPVLGPFGESPETFTAAGAGPGQIVPFAVAVAVVPILTVWALAAVSRVFGARARSVVQTVVVAGLAALAAVGVARHVGSGVVVRVGAALVVGGLVVVVVVHRRWAPLSMFLRYASPVPILLVLVFLLASPVAPLVRPTPVEVDPAAAGDQPPVVFIVLDELPTLSLVDGQGGIDETLFPNLARVADTSTWYRNHTAVAGATQASLPAMLTGRLATTPAEERPANHREHPDNLITLLARTHEVHGREWATEMCPRSLCPSDAVELDEGALELVANPLSERADPVGTLVGEARTLWWSQVWPPAPDFRADFTLAAMTEADDLIRVPLEFLSGITESSGDRPVFEYLHSPLPHTPWRLLPSGESYDGPDPPIGGEFFRIWAPGDTGEQLAAAARTRHLLQLQWADRSLGAIIDRLEAVDRWDDAVVVVAGKVFVHGQVVGLGETGGEGAGVLGDHGRVGAVGAIADHGTIGLGGHVDHGGEVDRDAQLCQLAAPFFRQALDLGGGHGLGHGPGRGEVTQAGRGVPRGRDGPPDEVWDGRELATPSGSHGGCARCGHPSAGVVGPGSRGRQLGTATQNDWGGVPLCPPVVVVSPTPSSSMTAPTTRPMLPSSMRKKPKPLSAPLPAPPPRR
jgi:hypothetical protein